MTKVLLFCHFLLPIVIEMFICNIELGNAVMADGREFSLGNGFLYTFGIIPKNHHHSCGSINESASGYGNV